MGEVRKANYVSKEKGNWVVDRKKEEDRILKAIDGKFCEKVLRRRPFVSFLLFLIFRKVI